MKQHTSYKWAVAAVFVLSALMLLAACASGEPAEAKVEALSEAEDGLKYMESGETEVLAVGDSAAGVEYMKESCTLCHSVPDPATIRPFDQEGARKFLAGHMVSSGKEDLDNMIAYFFHLS